MKNVAELLEEIHIVILEDSEADAELITIAIEDDFRIGKKFITHKKEEFFQEISTYTPDIIITDFNLPGFTGLDVLPEIRKVLPNTPVIFVSGTIGEERAVDLLKNGATDYVLKNKLKKLPIAIKRALEEQRLKMEHQIAEQRLIENEKKFRYLFEQALAEIYILEPNRKTIIDINNRALENIGYQREDLIGLPFERLIEPSGRFEFRKLIELRDTRDEISYTTHHMRKDRSKYPVESNATLVNIGKHSAIQVLSLDITERYEAEQILRDSEERYSLASEVGKIGVWEAIPDENKIYFDKNLPGLFGYDQWELSHNLNDWNSLIFEEDRNLYFREVRHVLANEQDEFVNEQRIIRKDGSIGWLLVKGKRISPVGEDPIRLVGSSVDITSRKEMEIRLKHANDEMQYVNRIASLSLENAAEPEIISEILNSCFDYTGAPIAVAYKYDQDTDVFRFMDAVLDEKAQKAFDSNFSIRVGEFAPEIKVPDYLVPVLKAGKTMFLDGLEEIFELLNKVVSNEKLKAGIKGFSTDSGSRSLALVPLVTEGEPFGFLAFGLKKPLEDPVLKGLDHITHQVSLIISKYWSEEKVKLTLSNLEEAQAIAKLGSFEWVPGAGRLSRISPEVKIIHGIKGREEFVELKDYLDLVHPEDKENFRELLMRAEKIGRSGVLEYRSRYGKDWKWLICRVTPYMDEDKVSRIAGTIQDITTRRNMEDNLRESRLRLKGIFDNTFNLTALLHPDGRVIKANKAILDLSGLTEKEVEGNLFFEVAWPELPSDVRYKLVRAFLFASKGKFERSEFDLSTPDGDSITIDFSLKPIFDEFGKVKFLIAEGRDISELKQKEVEKTRLIERLTKQNKELNEYAYILSHNLRAPIANLIGLSSIFDRENLEAEMNIVVLDKIEESAKRLDDTLRDINHSLTFRHQKNEGLANVRFEEVLTGARELLGVSEWLENTKLHVDFAEVPEIISVKSYLTNIMYNLLSNAIKYHHPERQPEIWVKTYTRPCGTILEVTDNGLGVELNDETREKIFGFYQRLNNTHEGKGLGLYLVKTQMDSLGGKVQVESTLGEGTTFKCCFPEIKELTEGI